MPPSSAPRTFISRVARLRVPLGFLCAVVVLWLAVPTRVSLAVGAVIAVVGEALRIWAAGHLNKSREVTSSGPYRFFAHPLYVGSSVMALGVAVASSSVIVGVVIALYMGATITAAIRHEEAFIRRCPTPELKMWQQPSTPPKRRSRHGAEPRSPNVRRS